VTKKNYSISRNRPSAKHPNPTFNCRSYNAFNDRISVTLPDDVTSYEAADLYCIHEEQQDLLIPIRRMTFRDLASYLFHKQHYRDFDSSVTDTRLTDCKCIFDRYLDDICGHTFVSIPARSHSNKQQSELSSQIVNSWLTAIGSLDRHDVAKTLASKVLVTMINFLKAGGYCQSDLSNPIYCPDGKHPSCFSLSEYREIFCEKSWGNNWGNDYASYAMGLVFALLPLTAGKYYSERLLPFIIEKGIANCQTIVFLVDRTSNEAFFHNCVLSSRLYGICSSGLIRKLGTDYYQFDLDQYMASFTHALQNIGYSEQEVAIRKAAGHFVSRCSMISPNCDTLKLDLEEQDRYLRLFIGI
jgi:hypothetical protein